MRARWRAGAGSALLECATSWLVLCVLEFLLVLFCWHSHSFGEICFVWGLWASCAALPALPRCFLFCLTEFYLVLTAFWFVFKKNIHTDQRKIPLHLFTIGFQKPGICADSWFLESNGKKVQWDFSLITYRDICIERYLSSGSFHGTLHLEGPHMLPVVCCCISLLIAVLQLALWHLP